MIHLRERAFATLRDQDAVPRLRQGVQQQRQVRRDVINDEDGGVGHQANGLKMGATRSNKNILRRVTSKCHHCFSPEPRVHTLGGAFAAGVFRG